MSFVDKVNHFSFLVVSQQYLSILLVMILGVRYLKETVKLGATFFML